MASRIATGFHRIGIVLAVPLVALSVGLLVAEWRNPSGPYKAYSLPEGTHAWKPDKPDAATRALIADQEAAHVEGPQGFVIVGKVLRKDRNPTSGPLKFDDILMGVPEWTVFQLRDGREISIATTDDRKASDAAADFLYDEKRQGQPRGTDYRGDHAGVGIAFLNFYNADPAVTWPTARPADTARSMEWALAAVALAAAVGVYVCARALGWVIDGFVKPSAS